MKFCFISKGGSTAADYEDDEQIKGRETERIHPLNLLLYYVFFFFYHNSRGRLAVVLIIDYSRSTFAYKNVLIIQFMPLKKSLIFFK
jgi:hypothetical protein